MAACLCSPLSGALTEKTQPEPGVTTNASDRLACQRQLNMIYGAIQEYQLRHKKLPDWLSDLTPEFIHDPKTLECPFVRSTGNLKQWRQLFRDAVFKDPGSCTYAYEFCIKRFYIPGWTHRDYKQRQMELIGLSVPIVRCFAHRPILNLGVDGSIYPSRGEWEDNFIAHKEHAELFHNVSLLTNRSQNELILRGVRQRPPEVDARMLDLSKHYNALLLHLAQLDDTGNLLASYPEGVKTIGGVEFDIRALVHLTGKNFPIAFPERVEGIRVDRKCAQIHFLHGTMFSAPMESRIAHYLVRYEDGVTNEIPILYGKDVKTRWFDVKQEAEDPNAKPAWVSPSDQIGTSGKCLRLYVATWKNRRPDFEVKSIDFVSQITESAPFLIAITTE